MANVVVTSPVDTVMAVGRTAPMTAQATDAGGAVVSTTFSWNSTNPSVATVSGSGVVDAQASGTTTIGATAQGQTGSLSIRAVNADLAAVTSALTDPFTLALATALSGTPASTLSGLLTSCASQVTAGHVRAIDQCLTDALNLSGVNGNDDALLAVLALFFAHAQEQLQL